MYVFWLDLQRHFANSTNFSHGHGTLLCFSVFFGMDDTESCTRVPACDACGTRNHLRPFGPRRAQMNITMVTCRSHMAARWAARAGHAVPWTDI